MRGGKVDVRGNAKLAKEMAKIENEQAKVADRMNLISEVRSMTFTGNGDDIMALLQTLTGYTQFIDFEDIDDNSTLTLAKLIQEKMEFGIMRLNSLDLPNETR